MRSSIKAGQTITIEATKQANQRTRNRIREHGPTFEVVKSPGAAQCFKGMIGVLLDAPDGWRGSIQIRMIKITIVTDKDFF